MDQCLFDSSLECQFLFDNQPKRSYRFLRREAPEQTLMKKFLYKDEPYYYKVRKQIIPDYLDRPLYTVKVYVERDSWFKNLKKFKLIKKETGLYIGHTCKSATYKAIIDEYKEKLSVKNGKPTFLIECSEAVEALYK
jgi:hypothetical protein